MVEPYLARVVRGFVVQWAERIRGKVEGGGAEVRGFVVTEGSYCVEREKR